MVKILKAPQTEKILSVKMPKRMVEDIQLVIKLENKKITRNKWIAQAIIALKQKELFADLVVEDRTERSGANFPVKIILSGNSLAALNSIKKELSSHEIKATDSAVIRTAIIQNLIVNNICLAEKAF